MDRRKMNITAEKTDGGVAIQFNSELTADLKEYSEKTLAQSSEPMKYNSLKIWADYKFNNNNGYKKFTKYENNPESALKEVRSICMRLSQIMTPDRSALNYPEDKTFLLFNKSIPAYVCSVLLRDNIDELAKEDITFCKDISLQASLASLGPYYQYQFSDGVQPAIAALPILMDVFPEDKEEIKYFLLLSLISNESLKNVLVMAILKLWKSDFINAHSLLLGYLLLKPQYEEQRKRIRKENYENGIYEYQENQLLNSFLEENEKGLKAVIENKVSSSELGDIEKYNLEVLRTSFQLIPQKEHYDAHKSIVKSIIATFANKLLSDNREEKVDYQVKHDFLETYAYFVLNSEKNEIHEYLKPFLDNFNSTESIADLFQEFVLCEDGLATYDNFWFVWGCFREKVIAISEKGDKSWYVAKILKSYLFAQTIWNKGTKEWHALKPENTRFFKEISQKLGHCPSVLYAVSKLLNDIGDQYRNDGVMWVSNILAKNENIVNEKLEDNTIYYIERLVKKYIYKNKEEIKKQKLIKDNILIILDFLIKKGSVIGYMLRESIV
jgi:hypothetical protein